MTRPLISPHDQSATFVELFFDLVFVFAITKVVYLLHHDLTWTWAGHAILVFWLVWWAWTQFTWALNAADTEHPSVQFGTLLATAVGFFMAIGVPHAFDEGGALWFAGPYVAVRIIGLTLYLGVMREDPEARKSVMAFALASSGGLIAVLMGGFSQGSQEMFWLLVIVLDFVAATVAGNGGATWRIHAEHFAERHGLIVIIALGESLIAAAGPLVDAGHSSPVLIVGFLSVSITCALWWTYFPVAKPELEHALASAPQEARAPIARDSFSFGHFPMLCGVIAYATAIEAAVAHPTDPLGNAERLALALGLLLFVGGLAFALMRASCSVKWTRVGVTAATAIAIYFLTGVPATVSLGVAFAGVVIVAFLEERQAERMHQAA